MKLTCYVNRYNIILGLGSALRYLHLDWEQCVVHGDIKPSNIMLDSSHNTKLGDFGLARLVDHGTDSQSTGLVQSTVGYIDREFVNTFQRSTQSDVYSFGIVLLEIVSGRKPVYRQEPAFALLKWLWSLHSQDAILDAADPRLRTGGAGADAGERQVMERALVVGLWCALPETLTRPSARPWRWPCTRSSRRTRGAAGVLAADAQAGGAAEYGAPGGSSSSGVHTSSPLV
jgi:serine/threonine protein kinase